MAEPSTSESVASAQRRAAERALVLRVQNGDHEAFRGMVETHLRPVRAFVAIRTPSPAAHLIEEVAQEAFIVAYQKIDTFEAGTSFGAWVKTIAWNLLRRDLQRFGAERANRERLAQHVTALCGDDGWGRGPEDQRIDFLQRCVLKIPPQGRELLELKYHEGYSTKRIARLLGHSGDWVRTNLYRVRNQLRACIQRHIERARRSSKS